MNGFFTISIRKAFLNIDMFNRSCTCREWKVVEIHCEYACVGVLSIGKMLLILLMNGKNFLRKS